MRQAEQVAVVSTAGAAVVLLPQFTTAVMTFLLGTGK